VGGFVVMLSIIIHGITATVVMKKLDIQFAKRGDVVLEPKS
jgi:NhaP-type Na+/H+ or K+/H+ antiporter